MRRTIPLHPFLFAAFPVLSIWSANVFYVDLVELARPLAAAIGLAGIALVASRPIARDWNRAGVLASVVVIGFVAYAAVYRMVFAWRIGGQDLGRHRNIAIAYALLWLGCAGFLRRRPRPGASRWLNFVAIVTLSVPLTTGVFTLLATRGSSRDAVVINQEFDSWHIPTPDVRPDVFHIVLDGYARSDVLQSRFGVDDAPFLAALEQRGFFVAREANANYPYTPLSFAALFHADYLDRLVATQPTDSPDFLPIERALIANPVWDTFERLGYETYAFSSGDGWTQMRRADVFLTPGFEWSEFEQRIAALTPLKWTLQRWEGLSTNDQYRRRVRFTLAQLPELARAPSPKYVFAHVACPHPPYAFDADGRAVDAAPQETYWHDPHFLAQRTRGERVTEIVAPYGNQCRFIAAAALRAIDGILANGPTRPIILLHSDHGPDTLWSRTDPEKADLPERFGILQAFLVDDRTRALLHEKISPVNTFRAVLNGAFGARCDLLPDRSFFVALKRPYAPIDVTDRVARR